jgi:hypothetical protein
VLERFAVAAQRVEDQRGADLGRAVRRIDRDRRAVRRGGFLEAAGRGEQLAELRLQRRRGGPGRGGTASRLERHAQVPTAAVQDRPPRVLHRLGLRRTAGLVDARQRRLDLAQLVERGPDQVERAELLGPTLQDRGGRARRSLAIAGRAAVVERRERFGQRHRDSRTAVDPERPWPRPRQPKRPVM